MAQSIISQILILFSGSVAVAAGAGLGVKKATEDKLEDKSNG